MPRFSPRAVLLLAALTLPWLWPFTAGPRAATQPYLVGMGLATLALVLWPVREPEHAARLAALGWLAAAGISGVIALLQYFDLETPFFPWFNIAEPRQAFGNLRQPNQLASLLVIGVLALRWQVQRGRRPGRAPAVALLALLTTALAATASRVGLVELLACGALALWWARAGSSAANGDVAVGQPEQPVGALVEPWIVAGGQQGQPRPGAEVVEQVEHQRRRIVIEAAGRFVGEQQSGLVGQGSGHRNPLPFAPGHRRRFRTRAV